MTLPRSLVVSLALLASFPAAAGAGLTFRVTGSTRVDVLPDGQLFASNRTKYRHCWVFSGVSSALSREGAGSSATAVVQSDSGKETVSLHESDAWLHGGATLKELPASESTVTITLYDERSASLGSFKGRLGGHYGGVLDRDGNIWSTASAGGRAARSSAEEACSAREGCEESSEDLDIVLLAGEAFPSGGGYTLGLDFSGADLEQVAYADVQLSEESAVTTCDKAGCTTTTVEKVVSTAEVEWDSLGAVWVGDLGMEHEGPVDVKVKAEDAEGEGLESSKTQLAVPWVDEGEGVGVLGVDDDPLTTLGIFKTSPYTSSDATGYVVQIRTTLLSVHSSGWTTTTVPVSAELELVNGGTTSIPVNSYQRRVKPEFYCEDIRFTYGSATSWRVTGSGSDLYGETALEAMAPVCDGVTCVSFVEGEKGAYELSLGVYGTDAAKLPDELDIKVVLYDENGEEIASDTDTVEFDDEVSAVFGNTITFGADPSDSTSPANSPCSGPPGRRGSPRPSPRASSMAPSCVTRTGS